MNIQCFTFQFQRIERATLEKLKFLTRFELKLINVVLFNKIFEKI